MSAKGRILGALGGLVLKEGRVTQVDAPHPALRRVEISGEALRGVAWSPGDKVQVVLPSLDVRTYTPCRWDAATGATTLLIYCHGDAPGARWARELAAGDGVRLLGPSRSLRPPPGPTIVFGDETAFGLVLALGARGVLEVSDLGAAEAFRAMHLDGLLLPKAGERHLEAAAEALCAFEGTVVLAGRARSIQVVRGLLQQRGARAPQHVRAYWADGRVGLD